MQHYEFPRIEHIDEVRAVLADAKEFIFAEREWGTVVNYVVAGTDTFPEVKEDEYWCPGCKLPVDETAGCGSQRCPAPVNMAAVRRECRGLFFDKNGRILSRPLHKFFNVNERNETQQRFIDLSESHVILEKLDGSMIRPFLANGNIRWATKMGITDVSMQAEEFVARHPEYEALAKGCFDLGLTPIFEWCSRQQRIVIDYPTDRLVLIAMRDLRDGTYVLYERLESFGNQYGIPVVRSYEGTPENMELLINETRASEDIEGWIIRFESGHMVKIKGDWYLRIHKTKDKLTFEKDVVEMLLDEKLDDIKSFMLEDDRRRVEKFENAFWEGIAYQVETYDRYFATVQASVPDRKTFALNWLPTIQKQDPFAGPIVFGKYNGKDTRTMILDFIRKGTSSQTRIDEVRSLWNGTRWSYHFDGDA